jgi:uncharacterized protein YndB with AHSA1/START domain
MNDAIEIICDLPVPLDRAWRAFTEPAELTCWFAPVVRELDLRPGGRFTTAISGIGEFGGVIDAVEPQKLFSWTEEPRYLPAPTMFRVVFAGAESGTAVTVTQSGFGTGPGWDGLRDMHAQALADNLANLQLYLLTGVPMARELSWRSDFGALIKDTPAAPVIFAVAPGSFAEQAGLREGDVVVGLAGAPVFRLSDIWFAVREHEHGAALEVRYVRNRAVLAGHGFLGKP